MADCQLHNVVCEKASGTDVATATKDVVIGPRLHELARCVTCLASSKKPVRIKLIRVGVCFRIPEVGAINHDVSAAGDDLAGGNFGIPQGDTLKSDEIVQC